MDLKQRSFKIHNISHFTAVTLIVITGVCVAVVSHELFYGFVKEWFAAPKGNVWRSSGGKYSNYENYIFFLISLLLGIFSNLLLARIIFPKMLGLRKEDSWGCSTSFVAFLLTLIFIFFLGRCGKPLFF